VGSSYGVSAWTNVEAGQWATLAVLMVARLWASLDDKLLTQNWHGPGESDCLIKTKHCDVR
jgi:hypothetical protein